MSWSEYQERTYKTKPQYLAVYLANNLNVKSIVDLGCGSGNETVYFLKKGYQVTSIDAYLKEYYITSRITASEKNNLTLINSKMEEVSIPKCDALVSLFTLPFCEHSKFNNLWNKIYESINSNGYLVANLFGPNCYLKEEGKLTFTKEEVESLLKNYEIIKWKEQEYTRDIDNTHWHYFDFVARKK